MVDSQKKTEEEKEEEYTKAYCLASEEDDIMSGDGSKGTGPRKSA